MRSLSYKIGLGYFLLIVINIALSAFVIYQISRLSQPYNRLLKAKYHNVNTAENMLRVISRQELIQFKMVENGFNAERLIRFQTYQNDFWEWYDKALVGLALPQEPRILDSLRQNYRRYLDQSDSLQQIFGPKGKYKEAKFYHSHKILPLIKEISALSLRLKDINEQAIGAAERQSGQLSRQANIVIVIFALLTLLLSVVTSVFLTRKIVRPLKKTTEKVRRISRGHFNQKVDIISDDEIGELGLEFNRMTNRLQAYEEMNLEQLLSEKKKTEAIVAQMPVAIIVTDKDNRLILLNRQAETILNIPAERSLGRPLAFLLEQTSLSGKADLLLQDDDGLSVPLPVITVNEDGLARHFNVGRQTITDSENQNLGRVIFLQDVTEFKNLDQLKSEFIATVSHEIKTPLTSMNLAVDMLLKESQGNMNEAQWELLQTIESDVLRLKDFIYELLELSRLESGRCRFRKESFSAQEMIDRTLQSLKMLQDEKNLQIKIDIAQQAGEITGDFMQLGRVLTNLVRNAFEHSPAGGQVNIDLQLIRDKLLFCVQDYGSGIPQKALAVIFDKFVQADDFNTARKGKIGLGLAISREIIEAHGGKIWAESEPGRGSRFYFELPA